MKTTKQQIETAFRDYLRAKGYVPMIRTTKCTFSGVKCMVYGVDVNLKDFTQVTRSGENTEVRIGAKDFNNKNIHQNLFRLD